MKPPMFATIKTLLKLHSLKILSEERLAQALLEITADKEPAL